ncbi:MAG: ABC transporter permease [Hyphomicrobiales bacterium]|nr:ABC transporter permease [Hyphomicrobiales bacterium]
MPQKSSDALGAALLLAPALLVIAIAFLAPLARLAALSFSSPQGVLAAYRELLGDEVFWIVLRNTIGLAAIVTIITLTGGFALALALTRLGGGWRLALFAAVVLPLWISVLVRTFSWMLLLERNGPINEAMVATGVIGQPVQLLFNFTGVTIAMVHVLLPYAVLPIYAALVKIDPALLKASEGLGASFATTFRRVLLPLSARGVATAAAFVFLLSLSFFVTPALLGGANNMTIPMLIDTFVNERLAWPLAGAASMLLLGLVLGCIAVIGRFVPLGGLAEAR